MSSLATRLSSLKAGNPTASRAIIGTLPTLASLLGASDDPSFKVTCLACIARIFALFGKTDNNLTLSTVTVLTGKSGIGNTDLSIVAGSLDCLSTATLALREAIVPVVPELCLKAIGHLQNIVEEELAEEELHNAAYGFFGSLLKHLPWIISGKIMDDLLKVSHASANADLGLGCDQVRQKVLELMAQVTDPGECFAALKRTLQNAVTEGPKVRIESANAMAIAC